MSYDSLHPRETQERERGLSSKDQRELGLFGIMTVAWGVTEMNTRIGVQQISSSTLDGLHGFYSADDGQGQ